MVVLVTKYFRVGKERRHSAGERCDTHAVHVGSRFVEFVLRGNFATTIADIHSYYKCKFQGPLI